MDMRDIEKEIERLEKAQTTYENCSKLATLYTIRDHNIDTVYSEGSEFLRSCTGHSVNDVLSIINEHMEAIQLMYPKEYTVICNKINNLK